MNVLAALQSLRENGSRAILSAVGVAVGSIAILLLVSIGQGVQKDISFQVEDLGANVIVVVPGRVELGGFNPNLGGQSFFREEDADRLALVPGVRRVATLSFTGGGIRHADKDAFPFLIAASPDWFGMHQVQVAEGRLYTDQDAASRVVVLGSIAREQLFGTDLAIGKSVEINRQTYTVVGLLEDRKSEESLFSMQGFQNVAYIPYRTWKVDNPTVQIDRFMVQADPLADPEVLVPALDAALGQRLDRQQYSVLTQEDLLGLIFRVMSILTTLVVGLTSIALFVAGVGVMTVMLMAVNERRKEIGVRKATGARQRDIFRQFLVESVVIGTAGVVTGLAVSWVACLLLAEFTRIKPLMTGGTVLLALGVGVGLGAVFGLIPAMQAARQDPVVSLRNE